MSIFSVWQKSSVSNSCSSPHHHHHVVRGAVIDQQLSVPIVYGTPGGIQRSTEKRVALRVLAVLGIQHLQVKQLGYVDGRDDDHHQGDNKLPAGKWTTLDHRSFSCTLNYP